jgi:F0F1-type ATP synthase delta subunit
MKNEKKKSAEIVQKILEKEDFAVLILAHEFDDQTIKEIKKRAEKILQKEVRVEFDKGIIGGFIIKDENQIIDASIKGALRRIRDRYGNF